MDDNALIREGVADALVRAHKVTAVDSGSQAVAMAEKVGFDVILMDIHMPGMSGIEAARQIRALGGERGATPIIAFTATISPEDIAEARRAGMNDVLRKGDVTLEDLCAALAAVAGST